MTSKRSNAPPIYGNYHGYYSKRPFIEDQRLGLLPKDLFVDKRVLDVGCNEGLVTCQIAQSLGARKIIGVDIDESLIRAAWKRRRTVWSQQEPPRISENASPNATAEGSNKKRKRAELPSRPPPPQPDHFPASCEHMFGPLPVPAQSTKPNEFPHNATFRAADWVNTEIMEDTGGYDVVVAFSVSKWIHLNGGDKGLVRFFRRVHNVLKPGGVFILEPQPWDTYGKAKRMDAKLKETAKDLEIRPDNFPRILREIGFGEVEHRGETGEGGFHRPIDLYCKQA